MSDIKYLYETTIDKEIEETITETREENGKNVTVTSPIRKIKTIKVAIQQPDRKLSKGAELFYSKSLSYYIKQGLLPYSLVAKRFANDGGPLTEEEIKKQDELQEKIKKMEKDFFDILVEKATTPEEETILTQKKSNLLIDINSCNAEISAIRNAYTNIFDNTAEMKSHYDTVEWLSLFLINIDEDNKGYKPIFGEGDPTKADDYNKKISKLEEFENKNNVFYNEVIRKLSYLINFWFSAKTPLTQNDFKTMEKVYNDSLSTYKLPELEKIP